MYYALNEHTFTLRSYFKLLLYFYDNESDFEGYFKAYYSIIGKFALAIWLNSDNLNYFYNPSIV